MNLVFARELSFYIITIYVPTMMIVFVSWFSFWIDHKAVPARITLGVTTLLAMSTTQASIQAKLPPVAYTKVASTFPCIPQAIDVWAGACVFFVFSTLLEYALVNYCSRWVGHLLTMPRTDAQRKAALTRMEKMEMEPVAEVLDDEGPITVSEELGEDSQDPLLKRIKGGRAVESSATLLPSPTPSRLSYKLETWAR